MLLAKFQVPSSEITEAIKIEAEFKKTLKIPEIINIQPKGSKAKGNKVRQIRLLFKQYGI